MPVSRLDNEHMPLPSIALALMATQSVVLPNTEPAKQLTSYLQAINSGNRDRLRTFIRDRIEGPPNDPGFVNGTLERQWTTYTQTSGLTLRKVLESTPISIRVLTQARSTGSWMEVSFFVAAKAPDYREPAAPFKVVGMSFSNCEAPYEFVEKVRLSDAQVGTRVDAMIRKLVAQDAFSGTVTVAKNGRPFYSKAFGLATRAWNVKNRIDTKFNLASITKMFTAVAVAQLVEAGKLSFNQTVGEVLPEYPNKDIARDVTVKQLLSHTSGMIGARALIEKDTPDMEIRTVAEMAKSFVAEPLSFTPGERSEYSNAGYILLGLIIEKASGQSYYDYLRTHIFHRTGMSNTDFYELDTHPKNLAEGFEDAPGGSRRNNIFALGVKGSPAGGAYSTGSDMARFAMALSSGKLVSKTMVEQMWTGVTENGSGTSEYGLGATISTTNGYRVISHGGGWRGITNHFAFLPELGYSIVILSNYDDDPISIDYKVREWLTQRPDMPRPIMERAPAVSVVARPSSDTAMVGERVTIEVEASNLGGTAHAAIVDMEIKDSAGAKIFQRFTCDQKISSGKAKTYTYTWIPSVAGTFTVGAGVFGQGWQSKYIFQDALAAITVKP